MHVYVEGNSLAMRFGFHISIAEGFSTVIAKAENVRCDTMQLFSRNPRGWNFSGLPAGQVADFRQHLGTSGISPVFLHLPYLPNLASPDAGLYARSVDSLCAELGRAELLGIPFVVVHVGKRMNQSQGEAVARVAAGINRSLQCVSNGVTILLENTAGQGTELGSSFSQLWEIFSCLDDQQRVGLCLDTAHAFEAGYDLSTREGLDKTLEELDHLIGLQRLRLLHLNDSKTACGSHGDRHWHIGEGHIGREGFRNIVNHPLLKHLPGIMETPRADAQDDLRNMRVIRSLVRR